MSRGRATVGYRIRKDQSAGAPDALQPSSGPRSESGHSRRSRFGRESACPPISDMSSDCQIRRDVPVADIGCLPRVAGFRYVP
jgi:hypothetical protein